MSLKQKMEDNIAIFVLSFLVTGFIAGAVVYREILLKLETASLKSDSLAEQIPLKADIKQKDSRIKELVDQLNQKVNETEFLRKKVESQPDTDCSAKVKDCEKRLVEMGRKQKMNYDLQKQAKVQLKTSEQAKTFDKIENKNSPSTKDNANRPSQESQSAQNQALRVQADNFIFEAVKCTKIGKNIHVEIRIVNYVAVEESLTLSARGQSAVYQDGTRFSPSYLIDYRGNRYSASYIQFGNESSRDQVERKLAPGLPIIANLMFEGVEFVTDKVAVQIGAYVRSAAPGLLQSLLVEPPRYINPVIYEIPLEIASK
jgi:hypothetical protein